MNYIHPLPHGFIKNIWQIHPRDSHMEFTGKNRQYHVSKIMWLDWSKTAKQFSVNLLEKYFCKYQASRQASTCPAVFLSQNLILLGYFSEIYCKFCFKQMFNGFWTSNFDFYWSLALQFSYITVRLPKGRFLFAIVSN